MENVNLRQNELNRTTSLNADWQPPENGADLYILELSMPGRNTTIVEQTSESFFVFENLIPGTTYSLAVTSLSSAAGQRIQSQTLAGTGMQYWF